MTIPRRWKYAISFWVLYTLAAVFYERYPWVDSIWMGVNLLAVLALSIHVVVKKIRGGGDEKIHPRSPLGYPHWFMRFLRDDDDGTGKSLHPPRRSGSLSF